MKIPHSLIDKYNIPVPRYTSYPPANFFDNNFGTDDYLKAVVDSNSKQPENISIYIHIPFCPQLCLYCGCNTHITKDQDIMRQYVDALKKEILMIRPSLDENRKVSQVHWGGGTPNAMPSAYVGEIMEVIHAKFTFIEKPEIAIECNPAHLDEKYIADLVSFGFNRISMGVQDFQEKVLNAVHRQIPAISIEELSSMIKSYPGVSVNLDFIYGLPYQTPASFAETMDRAIKIDADRLVTFSYAHVPWVKKAQQQLEKYGLPEPEAKVEMFEHAWAKMTSSGYIPIGLDHYAKPNDDMAVALQNKSLHRNFQGYCTRETTGQVYAFGVTGISQLENVYAQNARTVKDYLASIEQGQIQIVKGYEMTETDKITRHIINEIMCNQYLNWKQLEAHFGITSSEIKKKLDFSESKLDGFVTNDLLSYSDEEIIITETGRFFLRNMASVFDVRVNEGGRKFSKSV